jgi:hypothetical protein
MHHHSAAHLACCAVVHEAELPAEVAQVLLSGRIVVSVVRAHVGAAARTHLAHAHLQTPKQSISRACIQEEQSKAV